eukprot:jgi/Chlat1/8163/Chrsp76S07618
MVSFQDDPSAQDSGPNLSFTATVLTGLVMVFVGAVTRYLRLDLEKKIAVASVRSILQLTVLGYVLTPIFTANNLYLVLALTVFMLLVAATEAQAQLQYSYRGMYTDTLFAMASGVGVSCAIGIFLIVRPRPWWHPNTSVPLWGMILGNALTAVALGLGTTMNTLGNRAERDNIEYMLARGARLWEACLPIAKAAVLRGLTPTLNSMSVIGLVAIPGMMTGQILGGASPMQAARYQIVIMFLLACSATTVVITSVLLTLQALTDNMQRLRPERLTPKPKGSDVVMRLLAAIWQLLTLVGRCLSWPCRYCVDRVRKRQDPHHFSAVPVEEAEETA